MAKKDVDKYFQQISSDYHELLESLRDMEEAVQTGMLDPDRLDQLKNMIEPVKTNYMRISYIMYLLNMPAKKTKRKSYDKEKNNYLNSLDQQHTLTGVHEENKQITSNLHL